MPISQRQFNAILRNSEIAYNIRRDHPGNEASVQKSNARFLKALQHLETIAAPTWPWQKKLSTEDAKKILCFDELMNDKTPHPGKKLNGFLANITANINQYFNPPIPYQYTLNPKQRLSPLPYFFDVYIKNKTTLFGLILLAALALSAFSGLSFFLGLAIGIVGAAILVGRFYTTKARTAQLQKTIVQNTAENPATVELTVPAGKQPLPTATLERQERPATQSQSQRSIFAAINPRPSGTLPDVPTTAPRVH